jgi:hypothetical protein
MATKTKTATKTFTEADFEAEIARRLAEREKSAKAAKVAAKAAKDRPGLNAIPTTEADTENNVLARCVYNTGDHAIHGTAVMVNHDGKHLPRFGLSVRGIFRIPGDTDTDAERLVSAMVAKAEHAPAMLAMLTKAYTAAAKGHTFRVKEKAAK